MADPAASARHPVESSEHSPQVAAPRAAEGNDGGLQDATKRYNFPGAAPPQVRAPIVAPLQPRQLDAIELLLLGRSDRAVARVVKVHRVTVTKWRLYDPSFRAELNRRREQKWSAAEDGVRAMLGRALRVFRTQLRSDDPAVSFRAARSLLQMTGSGRFAPAPGPTDAIGVIDQLAREKHVQRMSHDPQTERVGPRDRFAAVQELKLKQRLLEQEQRPEEVPEDAAKDGNADDANRT